MSDIGSGIGTRTTVRHRLFSPSGECGEESKSEEATSNNNSISNVLNNDVIAAENNAIGVAAVVTPFTAFGDPSPSSSSPNSKPSPDGAASSSAATAAVQFSPAFLVDRAKSSSNSQQQQQATSNDSIVIRSDENTAAAASLLENGGGNSLSNTDVDESNAVVEDSRKSVSENLAGTHLISPSSSSNFYSPEEIEGETPSTIRTTTTSSTSSSSSMTSPASTSPFNSTTTTTTAMTGNNTDSPKKQQQQQQSISPNHSNFDNNDNNGSSPCVSSTTSPSAVAYPPSILAIRQQHTQQRIQLQQQVVHHQQQQHLHSPPHHQQQQQQQQQGHSHFSPPSPLFLPGMVINAHTSPGRVSPAAVAAIAAAAANEEDGGTPVDGARNSRRQCPVTSLGADIFASSSSGMTVTRTTPITGTPSSTTTTATFPQNGDVVPVAIDHTSSSSRSSDNTNSVNRISSPISSFSGNDSGHDRKALPSGSPPLHHHYHQTSSPQSRHQSSGTVRSLRPFLGVDSLDNEDIIDEAVSATLFSSSRSLGDEFATSPVFGGRRISKEGEIPPPTNHNNSNSISDFNASPSNSSSSSISNSNFNSSGNKSLISPTGSSSFPRGKPPIMSMKPPSPHSNSSSPSNSSSTGMKRTSPRYLGDELVVVDDQSISLSSSTDKFKEPFAVHDDDDKNEMKNLESGSFGGGGSGGGGGGGAAVVSPASSSSTTSTTEPASPLAAGIALVPATESCLVRASSSSSSNGDDHEDSTPTAAAAPAVVTSSHSSSSSLKPSNSSAGGNNGSREFGNSTQAAAIAAARLLSSFGGAGGEGYESPNSDSSPRSVPPRPPRRKMSPRNSISGISGGSGNACMNNILQKDFSPVSSPSNVISASAGPAMLRAEHHLSIRNNNNAGEKRDEISSRGSDENPGRRDSTDDDANSRSAAGEGSPRLRKVSVSSASSSSASSSPIQHQHHHQHHHHHQQQQQQQQQQQNQSSQRRTPVPAFLLGAAAANKYRSASLNSQSLQLRQWAQPQQEAPTQKHPSASIPKPLASLSKLSFKPIAMPRVADPTKSGLDDLEDFLDDLASDKPSRAILVPAAPTDPRAVAAAGGGGGIQRREDFPSSSLSVQQQQQQGRSPLQREGSNDSISDLFGGSTPLRTSAVAPSPPRDPYDLLQSRQQQQQQQQPVGRRDSSDDMFWPPVASAGSTPNEKSPVAEMAHIVLDSRSAQQVFEQRGMTSADDQWQQSSSGNNKQQQQDGAHLFDSCEFLSPASLTARSTAAVEAAAAVFSGISVQKPVTLARSCSTTDVSSSSSLVSNMVIGPDGKPRLNLPELDGHRVLQHSNSFSSTSPIRTPGSARRRPMPIDAGQIQAAAERQVSASATGSSEQMGASNASTGASPSGASDGAPSSSSSIQLIGGGMAGSKTLSCANSPMSNATPSSVFDRSGRFAGDKQIYQYQIVKTLGKGTHGKVILVQSRVDSALYAIKVLDKKQLAPAKSGQSEHFTQVLREVAIMKKLEHPNCVRLYEALDDPTADTVFLVMEYVAGGAVMQVDNTGCAPPLSPDVAWCFFRDILSAVEYLHFNNILHRDIKPENMLVAHDGSVKLADFGVSTMHSGDDSVSVPAGTAFFQAPECLNSGRFSGVAADVWAMGACLYLFIYGRVPWRAETLLELNAKITTDELTFPPRPSTVVSPSLLDLLNGLLMKNPSKRTTIAQAKEHDWVTRDGVYPMPPPPSAGEKVRVTASELAGAFVMSDNLLRLIKVKGILQHVAAERKKILRSRSMSAIGTGAIARKGKWTVDWDCANDESEGQDSLSSPFSIAMPFVKQVTTTGVTPRKIEAPRTPPSSPSALSGFGGGIEDDISFVSSVTASLKAVSENLRTLSLEASFDGEKAVAAAAAGVVSSSNSTTSAFDSEIPAAATTSTPGETRSNNGDASSNDGESSRSSVSFSIGEVSSHNSDQTAYSSSSSSSDSTVLAAFGPPRAEDGDEYDECGDGIIVSRRPKNRIDTRSLNPISAATATTASASAAGISSMEDDLISMKLGKPETIEEVDSCSTTPADSNNSSPSNSVVSNRKSPMGRHLRKGISLQNIAGNFLVTGSGNVSMIDSSGSSNRSFFSLDGDSIRGPNSSSSSSSSSSRGAPPGRLMRRQNTFHPTSELEQKQDRMDPWKRRSILLHNWRRTTFARSMEDMNKCEATESSNSAAAAGPPSDSGVFSVRPASPSSLLLSVALAQGGGIFGLADPRMSLMAQQRRMAIRDLRDSNARITARMEKIGLLSPKEPENDEGGSNTIEELLLAKPASLSIRARYSDSITTPDSSSNNNNNNNTSSNFVENWMEVDLVNDNNDNNGSNSREISSNDSGLGSSYPTVGGSGSGSAGGGGEKSNNNNGDINNTSLPTPETTATRTASVSWAFGN